MRRHLRLAVALLGLLFVFWGIFDQAYRELAIAGAILLTGAMLTEPRPR